MAHFAVDDSEVRFCTQLKGKASWFLPFNKGWNDGAGNPPNPDGLKTDYLWKQVLARESLTNIIENYAQIVEVTDPGSRVWTGLRPLGSDANPVAPRSEALKFRCSNELHAENHIRA
jgi:hypothetical protein